MSNIPLHEIRRRLDAMGVDYSECADSRPQLERLLLDACSGDDEGDDDVSGATDAASSATWTEWASSWLGYCTVQ